MISMRSSLFRVCSSSKGICTFSSSGIIVFILSSKCLVDCMSTKGKREFPDLLMWSSTLSLYTLWERRGLCSSKSSSITLLSSTVLSYVQAVSSSAILGASKGILLPYPFHSILCNTIPLGDLLWIGSSPFFHSFCFFLNYFPSAVKFVAPYIFSEEVKVLAWTPGTAR